MILVDSSVWIAAWRASKREVIHSLTLLVESGQAGINSLIWTELVQGALDRRHQSEIKELLQPIDVLPFPEGFWAKSAEFYLLHRESGITLTTIDNLIASQAMQLKIPLWSLDHVYHKIPKLLLFDPNNLW